MALKEHSTTFFDCTRDAPPITVATWTQTAMQSTEMPGFTFDERMQYLLQYGCHCMSYSALQPGMQYFDMPGVGYIPYMRKWGARFALADPVCHERDRERLIKAFIEDHPNCGFVQVSEAVADIINRTQGFYTTQFGIESVVNLDTWSLGGKKRQVLRTAVNHSKKRGISVVERYDETRDRQLTCQWLKTRKVKRKEIIFLIRPMGMDYHVGTRKFYAYDGDELLGFIYFDPVYRNNELIGYVPNISRFSESFKQGIFYTIMVHAMEVFKKEGIRELHLGLCPLATDDTDKPSESFIVKFAIRLLYNYANKIYNFKGLYFTKSRFGGEEFKTFCCHKSMMPLLKFLTLFRIANVL
jgi:lysylphosphatidylglycerol synthetase-like protein (DUF2156 family)